MKGLAAAATALDLSLWTMWLPPQRPQSKCIFIIKKEFLIFEHISNILIICKEFLTFDVPSLANPHPTSKKKKDVTKGKGLSK